MNVTAQPAQPRLIVISAPSGAGKTTLCEKLIRDFPSIVLSISSTTRPKRPGETDGMHYHFLTAEDFQRKIDAGEFAEWAQVHGHRYGTAKSTIQKNLSDQKHTLFDIDVQGAMALRQLYGDRVLLIFIKPPSVEALEQRLIKRQGDSTASIETRLRNAYDELRWSEKFEHQILNDDLTRAYLQLRQIIEKECA